MLWTPHTQLNRSQSDNATKCLNDRRKLESEDSSYDSDHEYIQGQSTLKSTTNETDLCNPNLINWTSSVATAPTENGSNLIWRNPISHNDVSRSTSETLGAEYADYITSNATNATARGNIKTDIVNLEGTPVNPPSDIVQDDDYNSKLVKALKLGFPEELLKKALMKLGRNAGQDKILNELIRLQKLTSATNETRIDKATNLINENEMSPHDKDGNGGGASIRISTTEPTNEDIRGSNPSVINSSSLSPLDDLLLPIVIDGSNVAMSHGNKDRFSCKGIKIAVEFFRKRGHKNISVFVPKWRKESSKPESPITDQHLLLELEKESVLFFTPSRQARGKRIVCHDDRYILNLAADTDGVVVSNDNYRELIMDKPEYRKVIEERLLMYSFVNDRFMPPDDPLGRNGPTLDAFLKRKPSGLGAGIAIANVSGTSSTGRHGTIAITPCPYGKKCTYGNKCKFYHAERGNQPQKSITDKLKENSTQKINEIKSREKGGGLSGESTVISSRDSSPGDKLLRTQSMGRHFYTSSQEQLNMKGNLANNDVAQKLHLSKTLSSNPRIECTLLDYNVPTTEQRYPKPLWPATIATGIEHPHMQGQPSWPQMKPSQSILGKQLPLDTSLPPPPPITPWTMPDKVSSELVSSQLEGLVGNNSHRKLARQLTLNPAYDPRIPRSYQQQPPSADVHSMNMPPHLSNSNSVDPQHQQAGFPYPPPYTGVPPPNYPQGTSQHSNNVNHMMLTRNASAPEPKHHQLQQQQHKISLYGTQSTQASGRREFDYPSQQPSHHGIQPSHHHSQYDAQPQQTQNHHQDNNHFNPQIPSQALQNDMLSSKQTMPPHQPMQKTMSDSFVWGSSQVETNIPNHDSQQQAIVMDAEKYISVEGVSSQRVPSKSQHNPSNAVSPLIATSSVPGVWDSSTGIGGTTDHEVKRNLGPIGSKLSAERTFDSLDSERHRIYNHLTALFPKEQVIQAMTALPEERNPEQICKYIILLKNSQRN